jgi:thymidine kinase
MSQYGKFTLILGPMFSGKSSFLIQNYKRYKIAGKKCLVIKYAGDDRYEKKSVITHDQIAIEAIPTNKLLDLEERVNEFEVICIDEIQFFEDGVICDNWANKGKIVIASGLNGTFQRKPWKVISDLIPLADDIIHLKAVCRDTGNDAPFTHRIVSDKNDFLIGGSEAYSALDRKTFNHL